MTLVLTVGGIAAAHAAARSRGATLIHVRTHIGHTMLPPAEYADIIDLTALEAETDGCIAYIVERLPVPGPDAILCLHDDVVVFGAQLAESLGLPFAPLGAAEATVDKIRMREVLQETALGNVAYGTVSGKVVTWHTPRPTGPVVLKPATGRGSIGVRMLPNASAVDFLVAAHPDQFEGYAVEERIFGAEYSVESIITSSGEWHGVTAKQTRDAVEVGHIHPAPMDPGVTNTIRDTAIRAARFLGVNRGLLHTEVILDDTGIPHVVETHLRGGGDGILDLVKLTTGLDLTQLYVDDVLLCLQDFPQAKNHGFASSQYSFPDSAGIIDAWDGIEEAGRQAGVVRVGTVPTVGDRVDPSQQSSYARLAWAIATASTPESAQRRARLAAHTVRPRWRGEDY